jgi:hypothetical protein
VLLVDVTQAASEVSRLVDEARDLNLPVEPGARQGRDALVRSTVLLEELLPCPLSPAGSSRIRQRPPQGGVQGPLARKEFRKMLVTLGSTEGRRRCWRTMADR